MCRSGNMSSGGDVGVVATAVAVMVVCGGALALETSLVVVVAAVVRWLWGNDGAVVSAMVLVVVAAAVVSCGDGAWQRVR
ncbi:hypothetical protein Tco_1449878 [Tanacetum coccineum]